MKKTKMEKGITLIALIITIIVLLILAVVTIGAITNSDGGIFSYAQESKFKTEVRQYQEYVQNEKADLLISNKGEDIKDFSKYDLTATVPIELKEKYKTKLEVLQDGELYYIAKNLKEKEIQWCKELGIGESTISIYATNRAQLYFDKDYIWVDGEETKGIIDLEKVRLDIKGRYPDAVISYLMVMGSNDNSVFYAFSSQEYVNMKNLAEKRVRLYEYCKQLNKTNITEADIQDDEIKAIATELNITFPTTLTKIKALAELSKVIYLALPTLNVFYNDEHVYLGACPSIDYADAYSNVEIGMMPKAKADEMLIFEEAQYDQEEYDFIGTYLKVTGYKTTNPTVPGYVITSDNELEAVEEIASEAFAVDGEKPVKIDMLSVLKIDEALGKEYKDASLAEIKNYIDDFIVESGIENEINEIKNKYTEDNQSNKDGLLIEAIALQNEIVKKEDYFMSENNRIYVFFKNRDVVAFKNELGNIVEYSNGIGNLEVLEGVKTIGASAFKNNMISNMYFPKSINSATDAFKDIQMVTNIKTKLTEAQLRKIPGFSTYEPFGMPDEYWSSIFTIID